MGQSHLGRRLASVGLGVALGLAGCKSTNRQSSLKEVPEEATAAADGLPTPAEPRLCAAIRGNGDLIYGHFTSLAALIEHYGMVDATAGGSSASITQFLYESMYHNPALRKCPDGACEERDVAARMALLLKSLQGLLDFIKTTPEVVSLMQFLPVVSRFRAEGLTAVRDVSSAESRAALLRIFRSEDLKRIINREAVTALISPLHPVHAAQEALESLKFLSSWDTSSENILFRPGFVDFKAVARMLGRVGSFYAGYEPADNQGMKGFLDGCAQPLAPDAPAKNWSEVAETPAGATTCGQVFRSLLDGFFSRLGQDESRFPSRANDPVGKYLPVLVSTSVLKGDEAANLYTAARARYRSAKAANLGMDPELVRFGYWGRPGDLEKIGANLKARNFNDLKSTKFEPLGQMNWSEVLSLSPAEPGLARALEITPTLISAGGWSDLSPTLVLRNLDCQNVVYITRQGEESKFAKGVAQHLGIKGPLQNQLFSFDEPEGSLSSYQISLANADGVWCTNWDKFTSKDVREVSEDGYRAPFELKSDRLKAVVPYANEKKSVNLRGCTPGVRAGQADGGG